MNWVSGEQINYYMICKTKLWLFSHNIEMENSSDLVLLGKYLDKSTYSREKHNFIIDNLIQIDFIKNNNCLELHEIKLSSKLENAHKFQLLYYMYYLKIEKEITCIKGILNYPKIKKKEEVYFDSESIQDLKEIIKDINIVVKQNMPKPKKKRICSKCAYFEFCFS